MANHACDRGLVAGRREGRLREPGEGALEPLPEGVGPKSLSPVIAVARAITSSLAMALIAASSAP